PQNRSLRAFSPNFDVYETAEAYYLEGELPGLSDKNAIDIEFADDRNMMIRGRISRSAPKTTSEQPVEEKRRSLNPTSVQEEQKEERKIWLSERTFGAFQRSFSFPTPVDLDKTQATLEAGVLRIMVPKHVFQGVKRIQV
ncbi:HSP20-like chaperone, partial [Ascodesmis nigricans]